MALDHTDVYDRAAFAYTYIVCSECDEDIAWTQEFESSHEVGSDEWYHEVGQHAKDNGWLIMLKYDHSDFVILCPGCRAAQLYN